LWTGIKYLWVQNKFFVGGELNINIGTSSSIEFLLLALKHRNKPLFYRYSRKQVILQLHLFLRITSIAYKTMTKSFTCTMVSFPFVARS
jgi:hypothetical protein